MKKLIKKFQKAQENPWMDLLLVVATGVAILGAFFGLGLLLALPDSWYAEGTIFADRIGIALMNVLSGLGGLVLLVFLAAAVLSLPEAEWGGK